MITYPQSIKRLGQFLTADCKSAGTPNGGRAYQALFKRSWTMISPSNPTKARYAGSFDAVLSFSIA